MLHWQIGATAANGFKIVRPWNGGGGESPCAAGPVGAGLSCRPLSASCGGFTLIELAVVLAIISMVLVLVLPRLPSSDSENLKSSARTLAATLRYAGDRAATGQAAYRLSVEPGTDRISVLQVAGDGGDKTPEDPLLARSPIREGIQVADVIVPSLGKVAEGQLRMDISRGGLSEFTIIHLRSPDDQFWTVMSIPISGKVKIYEGYQENPL